MERVEAHLNYFATKKNIVRRDFFIGKVRGSLLFNPDITDAEVLRSVLYSVERLDKKTINLEDIMQNIIFVAEAEIGNDENLVINRILSGDAVLYVDKIPCHIIVNARKWDKRSISEPPTETVIRGPREGFIEDIKTNLSLLQRRLKTPALAIEKMQIGRVSSTTVAMVYVSNICTPKIVNKIRERLQKVDIDCLTDSHYLQPLLEEHPMSIFHQTGVTEKPDIVAAKILEGRVAIFVDGSPMVLTIPFLFIEDFQSSEDYYERSSFATFMRFIRYFGLIIAVMLPGIYVAAQIFHYDIIPFRFLITLMNAIKGIPLPPLAEILFVILLFEIIREASVRMPRAVGMAMSIVGALVLGDTAVKAGIISSPAIMIVAISSLALYTVPDEVGTMTLLRAIMTIVGGTFGMFGLIVVAIFIIGYLAALDSYGAPYLAPFAPIIDSDLKDSLFKSPTNLMKQRPYSIRNQNHVRLKTGKSK